MICKGIDVSKEKSTVCILKPYGEIVSRPFEINHTEPDMKEYRCQGLRWVKTDKQDSITIANSGIDHWYRLKNYQAEGQIYGELKLLGRQHCHYMRMRIESVLELTHMLDYTMPGIKGLLKGWVTYFICCGEMLSYFARIALSPAA